MIAVPELESVEAGTQLGISLQQAFQRAGIPATLDHGRADSPLLIGSPWESDSGAGIRWELFNSDSELESVAVVDDLPSTASLADASTGLADAVAERVVGELLPSLRPTAGRLHPAFDPSVYVASATGAPGDGNEALERAAVAALDRAGIRRTDDRESADLILHAVVKVVSLDDDTDAVRIRWLMEDATGGSVGRLTQQNLVAAGSLHKRWGLAAFDAAEAIAEPVGDALLTLNSSSASEENKNQ